MRNSIGRTLGYSIGHAAALIFSASSGKGPLQALCLIPGRAHPDVALLIRDQDHRHRLRVDWLDDCYVCGRFPNAPPASHASDAAQSRVAACDSTKERTNCKGV